MRTATADLFHRLEMDGAALAWAGTEPRSVAVAWATCPRGDWLALAAARLGIERRLVVRPAATCVRWALPRAGATQEVRVAWAAAEAWLDATPRELRSCAKVGAAARRAAESATDRRSADAIGAVAALALACDDEVPLREWSVRAFAADAIALADAALVEGPRSHTRAIAELVREQLPFEVVGRTIALMMRARPSSGVRPAVELPFDPTPRLRGGGSSR